MFDYRRANPTNPPINPHIFCLIFDHDIPSYSHCGGFIAQFRGEKITQLLRVLNLQKVQEGDVLGDYGPLVKTAWWFQNSFNQRIAVDRVWATSTEMFNDLMI